MTDALLSSQIKTEYVHSKPTLSKVNISFNFVILMLKTNTIFNMIFF